ncbi:MAG: hypothetical protein ACTSRG_12955 [Candidatus Helarchaeota archaeon]
MDAKKINETIGKFVDYEPSPRFKLRNNELGLEEMVFSNYPFYTEDLNLIFPIIRKLTSKQKNGYLLKKLLKTILVKNKTNKQIKFKIALEIAHYIKNN